MASAALTRCAQAQTRIHAVEALGVDQLREWSSQTGRASGLGWREYAAGSASSVLAGHALIAAAAEPSTTALDAERIDAAYVAMCAAITILDSVVDAAEDQARGMRGFVSLYEPGELTESLPALVRDALARTREAPNAAHHAMTLAGVIAYYTSHPGARRGQAREIARRVRAELSPTVWPALAVMQHLAGGQDRAPSAPRAVRETPAGGQAEPPAPTEPRMRVWRGAVTSTRGKRESTLAAEAASRPWGSRVLAADRRGDSRTAPAPRTRATRSPQTARAAASASVKDEGKLHLVKSSGSTLYDEGTAHGSLPGSVKIRFLYNGNPQVSAQITIYAHAGTIVAHANAQAVEPEQRLPELQGQAHDQLRQRTLRPRPRLRSALRRLLPAKLRDHRADRRHTSVLRTGAVALVLALSVLAGAAPARASSRRYERRTSDSARRELHPRAPRRPDRCQARDQDRSATPDPARRDLGG